jgi:carbon storage regulator
MLVLTRKQDEVIQIGQDVVIRVIRTGKSSVKLAIAAPGEVTIRRGEAVAAAPHELALAVAH